MQQIAVTVNGNQTGVLLSYTEVITREKQAAQQKRDSFKYFLNKLRNAKR